MCVCLSYPLCVRRSHTYESRGIRKADRKEREVERERGEGKKKRKKQRQKEGRNGRNGVVRVSVEIQLGQRKQRES